MKLPTRKNNRKQWFDYTSEWSYFITICTKNRFHYFGKITNWTIELTLSGKIAYEKRLLIPSIYTWFIEIDAFVIMPNHIHWIIHVQENSPSISTIIKWYKQQCSKEIHQQDISFWRQKSFHDHIIRNEDSYNKIATYIQENPKNRKEDTFY